MNITVEALKLKVLHYLEEHGITHKSKILVAYSGGPDSSALLWILNSIRQKIGYSVQALYVNHGIRSVQEMTDEISKIKSFSKNLEIKIDFKSIEYGLIKRESTRTGRSIEELAREYRYSFLEGLKKGSNATHIAMGHTMDDQIETLIMRFFQGSGIHGLTGIPDKRDDIIRPFIEIEKKELTDYLINHKIPFVIDKTNHTPVYLRNKIRLNLIPVISEIFPGYKKSITVFSEKMNMIRALLNEYDTEKNIFVSKNGDAWIPVSTFVGVPPYLQVDLLYKSWDMWENKPFSRLPYKFLSNAIGYNSNSRSDILLDGYSCRLIKYKDMIIWKRVVVVSSKKSYLRVITVGDNELFPGFYLKAEEDSELIKDRIEINWEKLRKPILARTKISGDRILLKEGKKPLKKLFNEWGVLRSERWKIPVIEDKTGIIAVLGKSLGYSNRIALDYKKYTKNDKRLVLSAYYMENISE